MAAAARSADAFKTSYSAKKFHSPSKWFIAVKSSTGSCIFPSWSDCQRSQVDFSADDVELAAFPTIQQASAFLDSSPSRPSPATAMKSMDSSASTESSTSRTLTHHKKTPSVPNVVVLSTDDEDASPESKDSKKRKLFHEDESGAAAHKELIRRVSSLGDGARLTDINGNPLPIIHLPPTSAEEYLDASLRFQRQQQQQAAFANPAFAHLVNAATSISASQPSFAASYLLNMSATASTTRPRSSTSSSDSSKSNNKTEALGWSKAEDAKLRDIMTRYRKVNVHNWDTISEEMGLLRTAEECQQRWVRYIKPGVRKGQWTEEEDEFILKNVSASGEQPFTRWSELALHMPGRHGKQIRERWINHLNPNISHLPFTEEDDLKLWDAAKIYGKKWVEISSKFFHSTRAENQIKNRWYSAAFKKFITDRFGPDAYN
ncbi:Myb-like DNA-binding protein [Nitzschia inconspicua]|uniref:Myb-like DNA-binding protein n=1 Tax=Nitzschia inconspicua TaxID=303405 RepID=A0A9K3KQK6_9STRA|nr:Myb-like DNA-binding protein [Nitzschia inconspicua]